MKLKGIIIGIAAVSLLFLLCIPLFSTWSMDGHAGNLELLNKITPGMTQLDVEAILGKPWRTRAVDTNALIWTYGNNLQWCAFQVRFDRNGRVESAIHDH